jgi:hypothetical protein
MTALNARIAGLPLPPRMRSLPVSSTGYPIPWFVHIDDAGVADFRVIGPGKIEDAVKRQRCWLCGQQLGRFMTFAIGPMCSVNRVSAEPPSHYDCALYAVKACPFLTQPRMRRNEKDLPEDGVEPAGIMVARNPGVTMLWTTRRYEIFRANGGVLFRVGEPLRTEWFAQGREARFQEVMDSFESGLDLLVQVAQQEPTEAMRGRAMRELQEAIAEALKLMPPPSVEEVRDGVD